MLGKIEGGRSLDVQGSLKNLLHLHNLKASILQPLPAASAWLTWPWWQPLQGRGKLPGRACPGSSQAPRLTNPIPSHPEYWTAERYSCCVSKHTPPPQLAFQSCCLSTPSDEGLSEHPSHQGPFPVSQPSRGTSKHPVSMCSSKHT